MLPYNINDWAFRVGLLGFILGGIAVGVPQWIIAVPNAVSFGLRETCVGQRCGIIDFTVLKKTLNCDGGCSDAFDQFRLRWRAVEAFGWMGVVLYLIVTVGAVIGLKYEVRPKPLGAGHVLSSIIALFASGISIVVLWASIDCGKNCYEIGSSAICATAAAALCLISIPLGVCAVRVKTEHGRRMWLTLTVFVSLCACGLQMFSLLTSKFIYTKASTTTSLDVVSMGLFQKCKSFSCDPIDVQADLINVAKLAGCSDAADVSASSVALMLWLGAGCVGLGTLLCPLLAFFAYRTPIEDRVLDVVEAAKEEQEELVGARHVESDGDHDDDDDESPPRPTPHLLTDSPTKNPLAPSSETAKQPSRSGSSSSSSLSSPAFTEEYPCLRLSLCIFILLLVSTGNALIMYNFGSGLFCGGQSYCQALSVISKTTSCQLGLSSICSIIFNVALGVLCAMEIMARCISSCSDDVEKTHAEWLRFTDAEKAKNPDPLGVWHRWVSLVLLLGVVACTAFGTADPRWYVTDAGHRLGPWEECTGRVCRTYSTVGCGGGAVGDEKSRHSLAGVATSVGAFFGILSLLVVFGRSQVMLIARLGMVAVMEVCCVTAVMLWWQNVVTCDGTEGAICAAAGAGCSFGVAFWLVVAGMATGGVCLLIVMIELILSCCDGGEETNPRNAKKDDEDDDSSKKDAPGAMLLDGDHSASTTMMATTVVDGSPIAAAAAQEQPAAAEAAAYDEDTDPSVVGLDESWRYDPASGYWWSDEQKLFYCSDLREYCTPEGTWTENGEWPQDAVAETNE